MVQYLLLTYMRHLSPQQIMQGSVDRSTDSTDRSRVYLADEWLGGDCSVVRSVREDKETRDSS
jgi:hypothetical protein